MNFLTAVLTFLGFITITTMHSDSSLLMYSIGSEVHEFISSKLLAQVQNTGDNSPGLDIYQFKEKFTYSFVHNIAEELHQTLIRCAFFANSIFTDALNHDDSFALISILLISIVVLLKVRRVFHYEMPIFSDFQFQYSKIKYWHRLENEFHFKSPNCINQHIITNAFPALRRSSMRSSVSEDSEDHLLDLSRIPKRRPRRDSFFT